MEALDLLGELAELGVEVRRVRHARLVCSEQSPMRLSDPGGVEVWSGGADDQAARGPGVTRADLQRDLSAVAPTATTVRCSASAAIKAATSSAIRA
jgi:hypothetical protein